MLGRELLPWALLGLALGMVEGATAAVLIKHRFGPIAEPWAVNLAVGFVSGAPALSNVVSFVWSNLAHGRSRIQIIVAMQVAFAVAVGFVGLAPVATTGLLLTVVSVLAARMIWAGILTVRSSVWLANFPRPVLASLTGRILVVSSLAIAAAATLTALALRTGWFDPRWLYGGAATAGLAAAWLYRGMRVRREYRLLDAENAALGQADAFSLAVFRRILREDPSYREYMLWMGIYGGGGLMLTSQLVVILSDLLHMPAPRQILLLAVVPLLVLPLCVPGWARLFDGVHVVVYRSRQGWALVAAMSLMCLAVWLGAEPLLWIGAVALGIAYAGANLGWSLGHNDFASPGRAQQYMGVHVTLTGVRGVFAPPVGIAVYQLLQSAQPGLGKWSLCLPLLLATIGAAGFSRMRRQHLRGRKNVS